MNRKIALPGPWLALLAAAMVLLSGCGYNTLQSTDEQVKAAWSEVLNQYQRRADLVPNLVETVKGYAKHEEGVLSKVVELRNSAAGVQSAAQKAPIENALTQTLRQLFALAEAYPDLKANKNFQDLQDQMAQIEEQLQLARRYYNGTARDMNILVQAFPSNIIARIFGFGQAEYFEIELTAEREAPQVSF